MSHGCNRKLSPKSRLVSERLAGIAAADRRLDVGGGSAQVAVGTRREGVAWVRSIDIGSMRLTSRFLDDDPPGDAALARARDMVHALLDGFVPPLPQTALAMAEAPAPSARSSAASSARTSSTRSPPSSFGRLRRTSSSCTGSTSTACGRSPRSGDPGGDPGAAARAASRRSRRRPRRRRARARRAGRGRIELEL